MRLILKCLALSAAIGVAFAASPAQATLLPPGTPAGVPNAQGDPLTGTTIVANTGVQNFNVTMSGETITGTGQAWVVSGFADNPFAGGLTFVYQVHLTGAPGEILERITASSFAGFSTDVGYHLTGVQIPPQTASRSGGSGSIVGFSYLAPAIAVGNTSALLIINTNAQFNTTGTLTVQDGITANLRGFAPIATPEPATVAMAFSALPFLGIAVLRRRKKA